jgi:aconitate hydratase
MRMTSRDEETIRLTEAYAKEMGIFRTDDTPDPEFTDTLELDLSTVEPCLAGPKLPQDQIMLNDMKPEFHKSLTSTVKTRGFSLSEDQLDNKATVKYDDGEEEIKHGAVVIAAITSCTNTSNPSVMLGAGLVAKKAAERGLKVPGYVKTSLAPGSTVVTEYLKAANLIEPLNALGFDVVAYGCTTCIGNSGPLPENVTAAINEGDLIASAVLSGNRNFEGRVNPMTKANYLASPPLVVAYALAGTVDIDLTTDPIGKDQSGNDVFLKDIWPTNQEVRDTVEKAVQSEQFKESYEAVWDGTEEWNAIKGSEGDLYQWDEGSTYIQEPPFFVDMKPEVDPIQPVTGARCIALLGDSVTTDHISPAGSIAKDSPAAKYLTERGVAPKDFNSYGSRRGNDRVMERGTYANIRLRNQLAPGTEGGFAPYWPDGEVYSMFEACAKYKADGTPLVVLGGKEYGSGSSRDWAAKGPYLLGIKVVIAESYERIHRSNLVGMGLLPLQFSDGENAASLGLTGKETFDFADLNDDITPRQSLTVKATNPETGKETTFQTIVRIDTPVEIDYYRNGGILHTVLRRMAGTA